MIYFRHDVPYESQLGSRRCGAAALCMVYRSLGVSCTQDMVWSQIARPTANGEPVARTYLMCEDAQRRGLSAVIVRAMKPWPLLEKCGDRDLRVILSHRLRPGTPVGHYSVLVGIENDGAILHDPQFGPDRWVSHADLMEVWQSNLAEVECKGNIVVAVSRRPPPADGGTCAQCGKGLPRERRCPLCEVSIPLHPAEIFGCVDEHCPASLWGIVYCPTCDYGFR